MRPACSPAKWELFSPAHWKAEFAKVVWKAARLGRAAPETIDEALNSAQGLPIVAVDVAELWRGALARAVSHDHSPYDALFVKLAVRLGMVVASYDQQLRARFQEHVKRPGEAPGDEVMATGR